MTGTLWNCTPECWQKGSHTEGCLPIPDDRDRRIAQLEGKNQRLGKAIDRRGERIAELEAQAAVEGSYKQAACKFEAEREHYKLQALHISEQLTEAAIERDRLREVITHLPDEWIDFVEDYTGDILTTPKEEAENG